MSGAELDIRVGRFVLFSIGINDYIHWPKLETAVNDAMSVANVLEERYDFDKIIALYNSDATRQNIITQLRELATSLEPDDSLVVFYSGHGHLDDLTRTGSWIPVDAMPQDDSTWLDNTKIKTYIRSMKARHILLISDSCFSGDFFNRTRGVTPEITDSYVRKAITKMSRQAITSGGLETVADTGFENHSVFTYFLLKQLTGNSSPYLLPSELFNRVKGGVANNAKQQPLFGDLDDSGGELGGEFVLFLRGVEGSMDEVIRQNREKMAYLETLATEASKAEEVRQGVLKEKEEELKRLEQAIAGLKEKLSGGVAEGDTLDQLYMLVQKKEEQALELVNLKQKAEEEKRQRALELERLKREELEKMKVAFETDYSKYLRIYGSDLVTEDVKERAWQAVCEKWNVNKKNRKGILLWDRDKNEVSFQEKKNALSRDTIIW